MMKYPARIERMRQRLLDDIVATLEYVQYLRSERQPALNIINREEAKKRILVRRLQNIENGRY
jgi:hypothetical protein